MDFEVVLEFLQKESAFTLLLLLAGGFFFGNIRIFGFRPGSVAGARVYRHLCLCQYPAFHGGDADGPHLKQPNRTIMRKPTSPDALMEPYPKEIDLLVPGNVVICGNDRAKPELTAVLGKLIVVELCFGCQTDTRHFDTGQPEMFVSTVSHEPDK